MNNVTASLEISPLRAIALSQDLLASYKAIQQLLNTLTVGQIVEATVQSNLVNRAEQALLLIENTPVIVSNEQLDKLTTEIGQKVALQVELVNAEQLVLRPVPVVLPETITERSNNVEQLAQTTPKAADVTIDTTKLINLIEQINPDKKAQAAIAALATDNSPNQLVSSINSNSSAQPNQTEQSSRPTNIVATERAATKMTEVLARQIVINSKRQSSQTNTQNTNLTSSPREPKSSAKIPVPQTTNQSEYSRTGAQSTEIKYAVPQRLTTAQSKAPQSDGYSNTQNAVTSSDTKQIETPQPTTDANANSPQSEQKPSDIIKTDIARNNANQTNEIAAQATNVQPLKNPVTADSTAQKFTQPEIKLSIEVPNQQSYPLLAEAVAKGSNRLNGQKPTLSDSINRLLAQLGRLNSWQTENKRSLRSEAGQQLSKASRDISVAIKDFSRYVVNKQQLKTPAQLKKVIKNSGTFLEAKMATSADSKPASPTVHQDVKANVQRLLHATLYHVAKLQTQSNLSNPVATQVSQSSVPHSSTVTHQTQPPTDLVKLVKQKLSTVGSRSIPLDLPSQLIRILKQILSESNRVMSKLQTNQLGNLRADSLTPQWFFEIPVWQHNSVELLQIFMRQEQKKRNKQSTM